MEFRRNKETGLLEAWEDGHKISEVITMGDDIREDDEDGINRDS